MGIEDPGDDSGAEYYVPRPENFGVHDTFQDVESETYSGTPGVLPGPTIRPGATGEVIGGEVVIPGPEVRYHADDGMAQLQRDILEFMMGGANFGLDVVHGQGDYYERPQEPTVEKLFPDEWTE